MLVAQLGARRHYAVPLAFWRHRRLDRLITDWTGDHLQWRWLGRWVPDDMLPRAFRALLARRVPEVPRHRIIEVFSPFFSLKRRFRETQTEFWARRNEQFCRKVIRRGFGKAGACYAFNGAALELFEVAKTRGIKLYLDQTAAPWSWNSSMLEQERARWEGWEEYTGEVDSGGRLSEREEGEWALADKILCGSDFVADKVIAKKGSSLGCEIVPYAGVAALLPARFNELKKAHREGKLNVLFVGTLQLRKGVQYLWEAARLLGRSVTIRAVGPNRLSPMAAKRLRTAMDVVGPVSRDEVVAHYRWADVFVLPSLSEGSANVCHEAMSIGLPVVTTVNSGSIIKHGVTGLLVTPGDGASLASAIAQLRDNHDQRTELAAAARDAISQMNFESYAANLIDTVVSTPS